MLRRDPYLGGAGVDVAKGGGQGIGGVSLQFVILDVEERFDHGQDLVFIRLAVASNSFFYLEGRILE